MKRTATLAALLVVVSLALGGLMALAVGVPSASSTGSASPDLSLTCSVKASCNVGAGEVEVFRMSALSNAHAGIPLGSTYTNVVCCGGVAGLAAGDGVACSSIYDLVLALSDTDNAHVATTVGGTSTTEVCLSVPSGPINCSYAATCPDGYACLATISGTTNAHVADCVTDPYTAKVCCSDAEPVDCPDPGSVPWSTPPGDVDCDGYSSDDEGVIGTDPADPCANTPASDDEADDRWPPDFDDNMVINILDVGEVLPPNFGTSVPPTSPRYDLVVDGFINILDVGMTLPPYFGYMCT